MPRRHIERDLQRAVMNYFKVCCPRAIAVHIPNGGARRPIEAAILKTMGVVPGIPDLLVMWPPRNFAFIELKAPGSANRLSEAQKEFHSRLVSIDALNVVATSIDEVRAAVRAWGIPSNDRWTA